MTRDECFLAKMGFGIGRPSFHFGDGRRIFDHPWPADLFQKGLQILKLNPEVFP
jgi:hypothetical protein